MKNKIKSLFPKDYVTIDFLSRKSGLNTHDIFNCLKNHPKEFRKSFVKTNKGEDVYMINSQFSFLKDLWKYFCYINIK